LTAIFNRRDVRLALAVLGVVALLLALAAVLPARFALAAIPDEDGIIHACYDDDSLRVIDTEATPPETCTAPEVELSWNEQGPAGAPGAPGAAGPAGPTGPAGVGSTVVQRTVTPVNGVANLADLGQDDGVTGILCNGVSPQSGGNIPAMVVSRLLADRTAVRVLHTSGKPNNATVTIGCVVVE
jgi:hypothetical protein